jgi:hypothetical protein
MGPPGGMMGPPRMGMGPPGGPHGFPGGPGPMGMRPPFFPGGPGERPVIRACHCHWLCMAAHRFVQLVLVHAQQQEFNWVADRHHALWSW